MQAHFSTGDTGLLDAVLNLEPDLVQVALWGRAFRQSSPPYPILDVAGLVPLLSAIATTRPVTAEWLAAVIPPALFPIKSEADFLRKAYTVVRLVHAHAASVPDQPKLHQPMSDS